MYCLSSTVIDVKGSRKSVQGRFPFLRFLYLFAQAVATRFAGGGDEEAPGEEAPRDEAPREEAPRDEAPRDEAP